MVRISNLSKFEQEPKNADWCIGEMQMTNIEDRSCFREVSYIIRTDV